MAIRISETRPKTAYGEEPLLITSDALRLLESELRMYCEQRLEGRSFLIAGHRGAGKTTLVLGAMRRVMNSFYSDVAAATGFARNVQPKLRPLLVLLQGTNLLPPDDEEPKTDASEAGAPKKQVTAGSSGSAEASPAKSSPSAMETVLIQITLGLYRALANEFSDAYRGAVATRAGRDGEPDWELAAQFELDLDGYPGRARLREYWRKVDGLSSGILFRSEQPGGRGAAELVALASACEAYQRICGQFSQKEESSSSASAESKAELAIAAKGGELMKPLTALLAGASVGAGVAASNASPSASVFAGLVAALASTVVLRYSASRKRERSTNHSELFIPDLSVATLDRVLPVLIQRIIRAGLAPVFMVDELDKVDLSDRITDMVKRLKKLVAEKAFFCFLTDRKYFEELTGRTADAPYPIEYTYYSHQLFIAYGHRDLHRYLSEVLQTTASAAAAERKADPAAVAATPSPAPALDDDSIDVQILPYLILHASQMHTIDLRRQLLALRNENGELVYAPGEIRERPRFRYALCLQLAVETALEQEDMRSELESRPAFLQLARDALYYISRRWQHAPEPLVLDGEQGLRDFKAYLCQRMSIETSLRPGNGRGTEETGGARTARPFSRARQSRAQHQGSEDAEAPALDAAAVDFLFSAVQTLAASLTSVDQVHSAAARRLVPQVVLDNLPKTPLLELMRENEYRWKYFPSGREMPGEKRGAEQVSPKTAKRAWEDDVDAIEEFELRIAILSAGLTPAMLSIQFGILPTTPSWSGVERACKRLRESENTQGEYTDADIDIGIVREFRNTLEESGLAVELAVLCARVLRTDSMRNDLGTLSLIAEGLQLRSIHVQSVEEKLRKLYEQILVHASGVSIPAKPPLLRTRASVANWLSELDKEVQQLLDKFKLSPRARKGFETEAWEYWKTRLRISSMSSPDPGLAVIYCAAQLIGPALFLYINPSRIGIGRWSNLVITALQDDLPPGSAPPSWLTVVALKRLGFARTALASTWLIARAKLASEDLPIETEVSGESSAGSVILQLDGMMAGAWLPQDGFPILYVENVNLKRAQKVLREMRAALGLSIVALDGTVLQTVQPSPSTSKAPVPERSPLERFPDVLSALAELELTRESSLPVVVAGKADRPVGWPANLLPLVATNPQEFYQAVGEQKSSTSLPQ